MHARCSNSSAKTVSKLIDYTTKHYGEANGENMKVLRRRLIQAGIYDPARRGLLLHCAHRVGDWPGHRRFHFPADFATHRPQARFSGCWSWQAASPAMSVRASMSINEYPRASSSTAPAFRISWICSSYARTSGLSMEASLERVGRELATAYPSLSANIHLTNLEIRAGRPLKEALEHFADRLALEESRAFATLINQSIDLGSSITDAMRVYSDDMRHKRLSTRRGEGLCPAGQAGGADDGLYLSGAFRRHPVAGHRASCT